MTTTEYQKSIIPKLQSILSDLEVKSEWTAFKRSNHYSPRVDIAVGPFSVTPGNIINQYNQLTEDASKKDFLEDIYDIHKSNFSNDDNIEDETPSFNDVITMNQNARCFIAIEIENKNSNKHFMGSLINAASLGRVGVGIAYTETALRIYKRIINYLSFLKRVEKNTYDTGNFLLITKEQMDELLERRWSGINTA